MKSKEVDGEKEVEFTQETIDDIISDHSISILNRLSREDENIKKKIEEIALEYIGNTNEESIANSLFFDLDSIPVEDVWHNSGGTRDGYVDPYDLAWEMFEEAIEPYLEKARKYHELNMISDRDIYYRAILRGLYDFEKESDSEYKDWAVDAPKDNFKSIKKEWIKNCKDRKEVEEYVEKNFPDW